MLVLSLTAQSLLSLKLARTRVHTHAHTGTYTCTHRHIQAHTQAHTQAHAHTHGHTQRQVHRHMHTYAHTHTHRHIHTHTHTPLILWTCSLYSNATLLPVVNFPPQNIPSLPVWKWDSFVLFMAIYVVNVTEWAFWNVKIHSAIHM